MKVAMYCIIHIIPSSSIYITTNPYKFVAEKGYQETDYVILKRCKGETDALVLANDYRRLHGYPEEKLEIDYHKRWRQANKEKYNQYSLKRYHENKLKLKQN